MAEIFVEAISFKINGIFRLTVKKFFDTVAMTDALILTLIDDLGVRGVWQSQSMALFDIRIVDTDAMSYLSHSPAAMLASAEAEKKPAEVYCATSSDGRAIYVHVFMFFG